MPIWLVIYVVSCGFQSIFNWPFLSDKIQLPEFVFLAGLFCFPAMYHPKTLPHISPFGSWCIAWCLIHFVLWLAHPSISGMLETLGVIYLILLALFCHQIISRYAPTFSKLIWHQSLFILGWTMSAVAVVTYLLAMTIWPNPTAQIFFDYPYFGDVLRLQGFTSTPAMYVSIITLPIGSCLMQHRESKGQSIHLISAAFFSLVALLTFSKSMLFILWLWIAWFYFDARHRRFMVIFSGIVLLGLHVILTHFLWVENTRFTQDQFRNSPYTSNTLIWQGPSWSVIGSGYYCFKRTAWELFIDQPFTGTGPGNYNHAINHQKELGKYPQHLPSYDPHCSFLGALATLGIGGGLLWLMIFYALFHRFIQTGWSAADPEKFYMALLCSIMLFESISMDVMNFRHYWVFVVVAISTFSVSTNNR